jgi:hypothetical protein
MSDSKVRVLDSDSFDSFVACANRDDGADHGNLGSYAIVDGRHLCYGCTSAVWAADRARRAAGPRMVTLDDGRQVVADPDDPSKPLWLADGGWYD